MSGISVSNGKPLTGPIANGNGTATNGTKNGNGPIIPAKNGGPVLNGVKNGHGPDGIGIITAAAEGLDINNGVTTTSSWKDGIWSIGLINAKYKYLTAETFGFKINSNGGALKKKQIWFLEPAPAALASSSTGGGPVICLRSHLGRYLAVDQYGNVTCDGTEKNAGSTFLIHVLQSNSKEIRKFCLYICSVITTLHYIIRNLAIHYNRTVNSILDIISALLLAKPFCSVKYMSAHWLF